VTQSQQSPTSAQLPGKPFALPDSLHWFRDSAEQRALYVETYRAAAARARSADRASRTWGVILDVDETILDNSDYQKRLAMAGEKFEIRTWNAWIGERKAIALPGAKTFIDTIIDELHGKVVLITNRSQAQCSATEDNLHAQRIRFDRILCDQAGDGDKNGRFKTVVNGDADNPAIDILIWIGDNIQDFPGLSQSAPGDLASFGVQYFALPNPLYGSWQNVPPR
jgi:5'-nucleotidase (lipoprotein e(P4) family)